MAQKYFGELGVVRLPALGGTWLLIVDLDKTLWDSSDISALKPPFRKTGDYVFEDARGVRVTVYRDMVEALEWARKNGATVAVMSWNNESTALEALKVSNVLELIDFYVIEDHPRKDVMYSKLVETLRRSGLVEVTKCTVYIDDSEVFLEQVSRVAPYVCTLRAWKDFTDKGTLLRCLRSCLVKCGLAHLMGES